MVPPPSLVDMVLIEIDLEEIWKFVQENYEKNIWISLTKRIIRRPMCLIDERL